jgi:sialic acid synthase SpsE
MKILELFARGREYCDQYAMRPYMIAEAGVNHEGKMDIAKRLIAEAKEGGADAIKFQTYKADTIASKNSPSYWDLSKEPTTSQHKLFQKYDKFWKSEYEELKKYCDEFDIEFMSTPFDVESAKFLDEMMPVFKISSSDITNKPFVEFLCSFDKPIILSTGASYWHEVIEAVSWIDAKGNDLALLHCVLNYPTEDPNAHLGLIKELRKMFPDNLIGYSDHTMPRDMRSCEIAGYLGATIIEKHFTHDKSLPGNDHYHAMDKEDLKKYNEVWKRSLELIKDYKFLDVSNQLPARKNARRSLVMKESVKAGTVITKDHLTWKRPGMGVSPKFIDDVIGKKALRDIENDEIVYWNLLS